jgi:hypothetical protein
MTHTQTKIDSYSNDRKEKEEKVKSVFTQCWEQEAAIDKMLEQSGKTETEFYNDVLRRSGL